MVHRQQQPYPQSALPGMRTEEVLKELLQMSDGDLAELRERKLIQ